MKRSGADRKENSVKAKALLPVLGLCVTALIAQPALATTGPDMSGGADDGAALRAESSGKIGKGDTAFVNVTSATVWTSPDSPRSVDSPATKAPVDLDAWNEALSSTETRRGLTGLVQTQAPYGAELTVLDVQGNWAKVAVAEQSSPKEDRGYPGWVPRAQIVENDRFVELRDDQPTAVVTARTADLEDVQYAKLPGDETPEPTINVELPLLSQDVEDVRVALPGGGAAWIDYGDVRVVDPDNDFTVPEPTRSDLVETAEQFEGLRYLWGGVSPYGFDCSGFTYTVFRAHGIDIPRDAGDQQKQGKAVERSNHRKGDLLFFASGGEGRAHHVGMYVGDGKMIHAPNAGKSVEVVDWSSWDSSGQYVESRRYL